MIVDGFKLLVMGMGYVITFLTIMVLVIMLFAKLLKPFEHLVKEKATASGGSPRKTGTGTDNKNLIAAAIAAVHLHRNKK